MTRTMSDRSAPRAQVRGIALWLALALVFGTARAADDGRSLAGDYRASATEIGAGLRLGADGRFDYGLSYGALDETATGTWRREGDRIVLSSEPFDAPRIALISRKPTKGRLVLTLELPEGLSRQYFTAFLLFRDGDTRQMDLRDDGLTLPVDPANPPVKLALTLPIMALSGETVTLGNKGGETLNFRFDANEMGKADLTTTPVIVEGDVLIMQRHDRSIRFRRVADDQG